MHLIHTLHWSIFKWLTLFIHSSVRLSTCVLSQLIIRYHYIILNSNEIIGIIIPISITKTHIIKQSLSYKKPLSLLFIFFHIFLLPSTCPDRGLDFLWKYHFITFGNRFFHKFQGQRKTISQHFVTSWVVQRPDSLCSLNEISRLFHEHF